MNTIRASGFPSPGTAFPVPPFLQRRQREISSAIFRIAFAFFEMIIIPWHSCFIMTAHPVPLHDAGGLYHAQADFLIPSVTAGQK
jgi:hypothetical protein